jgi:hypothetical protein
MTPDNGAFAVAAYACAAAVYLVYAISLVARERKLRARLESREGPRH